MTRPSRHAPHLVASAGRRRFLATATGVGVVAGLAPPRARAAALDATAMLGWVDPDAITVWVQSATDAEAVVSVIPDAPGLGSKVARVSLEAAAGRTGAVRLTGLEPSTRYRWTAVFDGRDPRGGGPEAIEGHFRTPPIWVPGTDPGPVTLAFGSCHYLNDGRFDRPGPPYGGGDEIFDAIAAQQPDAMLWLGDNVYLREPEWNDAALAHARYRAYRTHPAAARLRAQVPQVAVWDDHDFGPNDADGTFANKAMTREMFRRHWPDAGRDAEAIGQTIASRLRIADVELFLLDDRWDRTPERAPDAAGKALLGAEQLAWLEAALAASTANVKVVAMGTQFFNRASRFESWSHYRDEQRALLAFLERHRTAGVVFLSGDRHFGELLRIERPGLYPLYECTASPLTAGVVSAATLDAAERDNPDLVAGTLVNQRHFGLLRVFGTAATRQLLFEARAGDGAPLWSHAVPLHALQPFDPR